MIMKNINFKIQVFCEIVRQQIKDCIHPWEIDVSRDDVYLIIWDVLDQRVVRLSYLPRFHCKLQKLIKCDLYRSSLLSLAVYPWTLMNIW